MAARKNLSDILGLPEAARLLGISRQALWEAIQNGRIKARKIGNTFIIHRKTLAQYKASKRPPGRPRKKNKNP